MKNDGKKEKQIKSKSELLEIISDHLEQQIKFADELKVKASSYIDDDEATDKKKINRYLAAYNSQVDAVSRTSATLIRITNSQLEDESEEDNLSLLD